jgi:hypothetical protein
VLELCKALDELLHQWERSKGSLSLQDSFHARHIAISYLPEALNTYLSIPPPSPPPGCWTTARPRSTPSRTPSPTSSPRCASSATTWPAQDAHAFLVHSKFLSQKFAPQGLEAPSLNLPKKEST